ncbi:hypothetical protein LPJ61_005759 [Coemansia biformis]|uniref:Uncharacterized protein n=1 Tax=Coemansia biformis TaxID=1286918 RepID=A0A9W7Y4T0_9FUNG|nr:hypothetical protein LPJ61_005759 [Coemansia biformis]
MLSSGALLSPEQLAGDKMSLVCSDPSTSLVFDAVHPGERIHCLFGYYSGELVYAVSQGKSFVLCESTILGIIQKYNLGTPAPKPASV